MRPLTAPAFSNQFAFRCTTAGTSATEPSWTSAQNNNSTVTTGGATFTNVSGQSAYGWSAAAGNIYCMTNQGPATGRLAIGDRIFLSSDHAESSTNPPGQLTSTGFGLLQFISVNRAGSVPPLSADQLSGAAITVTSSQLYLDASSNVYWQGITFNVGGTANELRLNSSGSKEHYFRNCAIVFSTSNTTAVIDTNGSTGRVTLDNTTLSFNAVGQRFLLCAMEIRWINTPSAMSGTVPTALFATNGINGAPMVATLRGVDLSFLTTTLYAYNANSFGKVLLDSCRIASGLVRLSTANYNTPADEIELVNCYDGTNANIAERHTPAGDLTTNRSTTTVGGAQDDVGLFSHQMVSSTRSDFLTMCLDSFWIDVENNYAGGSRTATVEIISSSTLQNTDISLQLEYLGTAGSSLASFGSSLPNALTASAALPTSTAVWNNAPFVSTTWNPADLTSITLSNTNLTASVVGSGGGVRGIAGLSAGKYYWECVYTNINTNTISCGISLSSGNLTTPAAGTAFIQRSTGGITINGSSTGSALGIIGIAAVVGIAVDFTAQLIWFRIAPAGNWNGSGTANPATGTGGLSISTISSGALYPYMCGATSDVLTANFGSSAFSGTVPSGFTSGIQGSGGGPQRLQVTFTPQQFGRLRGIVRLGKASTTVYVNPQITVS